MKRILYTVPVAVTALAVTVAVQAPGQAAPPATTPRVTAAAGAGPGLATREIRILTLTSAQRLANASLRDCQHKGFPVTVAVVDRDGVQLALLRDERATGATVATAIGKAYAAIGFQTPTVKLQQAATTQPGFLTVPNFVLLPGGEPVVAAGAAVAGIGVSGAPSGLIDDSCIKAGLKALR